MFKNFIEMHTHTHTHTYQYRYLFMYLDRRVIYKALCFDVAQDRMNGAPNETRTHSCRFASLAC